MRPQYHVVSRPDGDDARHNSQRNDASRAKTVADGLIDRLLEWGLRFPSATPGAGISKGQGSYSAVYTPPRNSWRHMTGCDPAQRQYQLWIFDRNQDEKTPVDGGVFDITSDGEVIIPIRAKLRVAEAYLFAVTIEKPGGVVVSRASAASGDGQEVVGPPPAGGAIKQCPIQSQQRMKAGPLDRRRIEGNAERSETKERRPIRMGRPSSASADRSDVTCPDASLAVRPSLPDAQPWKIPNER